jgi:hypothetical protein
MKLAEEKLVKCVKKRWLATSEGQKYLNLAANAAARARTEARAAHPCQSRAGTIPDAHAAP